MTYTHDNLPEPGARVGVMVSGVLCEAVVEHCPTPGMVAVQYRKPDQTWAKSKRMTIHPERLRTPPVMRVPYEDQPPEQQALVRHLMRTHLGPAGVRAADALEARQLEMDGVR